MSTSVRTWWSRPGLDIRDGRLHVAGRDAESVAREHGTPLYAYDLERVAEQAVSLRDAVTSAGLAPVVRLALKAQREPELLAFLRDRTPFVQMDVCSPGEIDWAINHGWASGEISYTGTNVSGRDLERITAAGVHLNVDLLTQVERVGREAPGSTIGIRVNPRIGASWDGAGETLYTGERPTKFGLFAEQLPDALAIAERANLTFDTVHVHVGDGYLSDGLPVFEETVRRVAAMIGTLQAAGCPIREVNTGGGLGVPQRAGDRPLDLDAWANILGRHLGSLGVAVGTEPGDFLVKECGVALAEVVGVEMRDGVRFIGLDMGWNVMGEHFVYDSLVDIVLCRDVEGEAFDAATISGNINEGNDLFAQDYPFPDVREGDIVAAIGVGSYNASMTSVHCPREPAGVVAFKDRR
ncbi:MAG: diaminopimelate decarboxylase [Actinomycetota bacterium]|jgi:diaminopimelate decarboxylase|nr:diaminopimelate decarboxylase [Actinomycetota bacterium]